jgi:integrase
MSVVNFKQEKRKKKEGADLQNCINIFFEFRLKGSKNTWKKYRGVLKEFFDITLSKKLNELAWEDLLSITAEDIIDYQKDILLFNKSATVNNKKSVVKEFFVKMQAYNQNIQTKIWKTESEPVKGEVNSWGALTFKEMEKLILFVENRKYKNLAARNGYMATYFKLLYRTGIRNGTLRNLTHENLAIEEGQKIIKVYDKTRYVKKVIDDESYELLSQRTGRLFDFSQKLVAKVLSEFKEKYNISEDRKIVLHSIRKTSADWVNSITNDPTKVKEHLGQSNINTTLNYYVGKNSKPQNYFEQEVDLESKSKEELIKMLKERIG